MAKLYKSPEVRKLLKQLRKAAPHIMFVPRSRENHYTRLSTQRTIVAARLVYTKKSQLIERTASNVRLVPSHASPANYGHAQTGEKIPNRVKRGFEAGLSDSKIKPQHLVAKPGKPEQGSK